jgi:hypothetical protein
LILSILIIISIYFFKEAKYTLALRKPYVPLKLQSKYQPRGWLGMLLNYKIFIDFADKPFEDSYNLLLKEIYHILSMFFKTQGYIRVYTILNNYLLIKIKIRC